MYHRHLKGFTLIEVVLAVAVGLTIMGAGVAVQGRVRDVMLENTAKQQMAAIAAALELFNQRFGYYPYVSDPQTGATDNGTQVMTYFINNGYLGQAWETVNAVTGETYVPKNRNFDAVNLVAGAWPAGEIVIALRNSGAPASACCWAYAFSGYWTYNSATNPKNRIGRYWSLYMGGKTGWLIEHHMVSAR